MAVLTECGSVNIACLYASALAVFRPIGVCRLYRTVPSTMLTEQRGHILEVGLAPIVGVFGEHQAHVCPLVVDGWNRTNDSIEATAVISYCLGVPLSVLPTELHQHLYATSIPFKKLTPKKPAANLCTELQSHNLQHQTTKSNGRKCHRVHRCTSNIRPI